MTLTQEQQRAMAIAAARRRAAEAQASGGQAAQPAQPPASNTGAVGQGLSGFNEGLAAIAGLPVDAMTGAINGTISLGHRALGRDGEPFQIENPVGGSAFNTRVMDPTIADDAPDSAGERYARSIGRDVGASAPFVAAALPQMGAQTARYLAMEGLSSVGSGGAEQLAEDAGAGEGIQTVAALLGGALAPAASFAARPRPQGETIDGLSARRDADYAAVRSSPATLPTPMRDDLLTRLQADMSRDFDEVLHPRAARALSRAQSFPQNPTISEIDELRQFVRDNVAGSSDAAEARIGQRMVGAVDDYLAQASQNGSLGPDAQETLSRLLSGRDAHGRIARAESIVGETGALTRAERRAATSGTGGNAINAMRQNIRQILDNPARRRGFTPEEIASMERVVSGSAGEDLARLVGRLSPQSGALPLMGNMGALAMGTSIGPGGVIGAAVPGLTGMAGQAIGEGMTRRNIDQVVETILNGRPLTSRGISDAERRVLQALIASRAGLATAEQTP